MWANGNFHNRSSVVFSYWCISCRATVPWQCCCGLLSFILAPPSLVHLPFCPCLWKGQFLSWRLIFSAMAPFPFVCFSAGSLPVFSSITFGLLMGLFCHFWPLPEDGTYFPKRFTTCWDSSLQEYEVSSSLTDEHNQLMMICRWFASSSSRSLCCFLNTFFCVGLDSLRLHL